MLAAISLYRLPDFMMGPMANPYYHDLGLTKQTVGAVRGSIGLIAYVCRHCSRRILLAEAWLHARPYHRGHFAGSCDCFALRLSRTRA